MDSALLKDIAKNYCYQYICLGEPRWPRDIALPTDVTEEMLQDIVNHECETLRVLINQMVSLATLSAAPQIAYKCLEHILNYYEDEHSQHKPFDVRRLPIPRLFIILPKPSVHWRFVTISANALTCFVRRSLPRSYVNQLRLFTDVFNFGKLRYKR